NASSTRTSSTRSCCTSGHSARSSASSHPSPLRPLAACVWSRGILRLDRRANRNRGGGARLVPEHDLALPDANDRGRFLPRPIALVLGPLAQDEGCARSVAARRDRDDPAGTGERSVPGDRLGLGFEAQRRSRLDDPIAACEKLGGLAAVPGVRCLST